MAGRYVPAERLADAIERSARPPAVTVHIPGATTSGVLLCGGKHATAGWIGGVALLRTEQHHRALITMWVPGHFLQPHPAMNYSQVPRALLNGRADDWPTLPPVYPGAANEWRARHRYEIYRPASAPPARRPVTR
jgi:hypothetical protein